MKRILGRVAGGALAALALAYGADFISFHLRLAGGGQSFSTVHVQPYLAVPQKNGKTEFILDDPRDERCSQSLFPQGNARPCWYVRRHTTLRVDM